MDASQQGETSRQAAIALDRRQWQKPAMTDQDKEHQPPKTGRPRKGTANLVTSRILDAATGLFLRNGFATTSIDMVAAAANCSKRTFYTRFPSKNDLFRAVVLRFASERLELIRVATGADQGLSARLYAIGEKIVELSLSEQSVALQRLIYAEAHKFPELSTIMETAAREPYIQLVMRVLTKESSVSNDQNELHFLAEQFIVLVTAAPGRKAARSNELLTFTDDMRADLVRTVDFFMRGAGLVAPTD